jgi:Leucine-rich repeat (LRR) protein
VVPLAVVLTDFNEELVMLVSTNKKSIPVALILGVLAAGCSGSGLSDVAVVPEAVTATEDVTLVGPLPGDFRFSPTEGPIGTIVSLQGRALATVETVVFLGAEDPADDVVAPRFQRISETEIDVRVPAGVVSGPIAVRDPVGTEETSRGSFTVLTEITFPDRNLESVIRDAINKARGPILESDVAKLTELNAANSRIRNLQGIEALTNLQRLDLTGNRISDVSSLGALTNLQSLRLGDNSVSDLSPLTSLVNLTTLELPNNGISDLNPLVTLTRLKTLNLQNNRIRDLKVVERVTSLVNLNLENNRIENISSLGALRNLQVLALGSNRISDLGALSSLGRLTFLKLDNNQIRNLRGLSRLDRLTTLILQSNRISDIRDLSGLTRLTTLDLTNNSIRGNLRDLARLRNLQTLTLGSNSISDVEAVSGLTNLQTLFLDSNRISDIQPLVDNPGLGEGDVVQLCGNRLNDTSEQALIPALEARGVEVITRNRRCETPEFEIPTDL